MQDFYKRSYLHFFTITREISEHKYLDGVTFPRFENGLIFSNLKHDFTSLLY